MIKRETLIEHFSICSTIIDQNAETIDNNLVITCYSPNQNNINFAHQSLTIDQIIKNELNNLETLKTIETEQYLYFFEKIETNFCFIFVVKNYYSKFNNFSDIIKNCLTTQFTLKIFEKIIFKFLKNTKNRLKFFYESVHRTIAVFGCDAAAHILNRFLKEQSKNINLETINFLDAFNNISRLPCKEYLSKIHPLILEYKMLHFFPIKFFITYKSKLLWSDLEQSQTKQFYFALKCRKNNKLNNDPKLKTLSLSIENQLNYFESKFIKKCTKTPFQINIATIYLSDLNSATAFNVCYFSNSKINIYLIWKGECNPNIDEFFKYSENIYYLIEGNIIYKQPTNQVIINHPVKWIFIIYKNSTTYRMITNSRVIKCSHSIELDVQKLIYQLLSNAKKKRQSSIKEFIRINEKSWLVFFFFLDHSCFILIENDTSKILNIIECAENVMKKLVRLEYVDIPLLILAR